ncbi:hypothetical protein A210_01175 [Pseudomonas putida SJTE-1]|uniref:DUF4393 domain-containing protein n=2 Tax=Pseudomonas TaxID=286 RepID=A0A7L9GIY4_9PSED|nr:MULTISPECIES: DUF4393 domain-containing protein [Pseudomonas]AFK69769.1 hypothetical protein YSA_05543 [Pseudomonas putida ND6]ANI01281.1 hypothetical protein A210_01175 [Pseudomonas putida SJTE-1]QOJ92277.1 DUF4393 domain-containing protein [Pseudomonas taiwanensis]WQQ37301.1 DUF4393 domain-containing protein [Pseudomonas putida]
MEKDDLESASTATQVVGELIKAAGDSPEAKQAGQNIGRVAVTLTAAIDNCLLPIAAVNFAFARAKDYFGGLFQKDIAAATSEIPAEALIEPKPSLAGPALQGLAFSHDEPDLKDLYIKLLATSMDGRNAAQAHPAFVEILRQLTAHEAQSLRMIIPFLQMPICRIEAVRQNGGRRNLMNHVLNATDRETGLPHVDPQLPMMVDNWIRLGLVTVDYTHWLHRDEAYSWMEGRPEVQSLRAKLNDEDSKVTPQKGLLAVTDLGRQFGQAVGLSMPSVE